MSTPWYRPIVETVCQSHELDPDLLHALILQESSGQADAFRYEPGVWRTLLRNNPRFMYQEPRRVASSYGLCQILYCTATDYGFGGEPEYLFLPGVNCDLGALILRTLLTWAGGDRLKALGAYNGGKGNWQLPGPQRYANSVLKRYVGLKVAA